MKHFTERTIRFIDAWATCTATELPYSRRLRMRLAIAMRNFPKATDAQLKLAEQFVVGLYMCARGKLADAEPIFEALDRAGATADVQAASAFLVEDESAALAAQAIRIAGMH
jgi:hypothetical protein